MQRVGDGRSERFTESRRSGCVIRFMVVGCLAVAVLADAVATVSVTQVCYAARIRPTARVNTKTLYKAPGRSLGRVLYISFEETGPDYIIRSTLQH